MTSRKKLPEEILINVSNQIKNRLNLVGLHPFNTLWQALSPFVSQISPSSIPF